MTALIVSSEDLYDRVARLERQILGRQQASDVTASSPVRDLLARLNRSL
jgi:hypothetical protein